MAYVYSFFTPKPSIALPTTRTIPGDDSSKKDESDFESCRSYLVVILKLDKYGQFEGYIYAFFVRHEWLKHLDDHYGPGPL